jgi:ABC-type nitrate/sulfonate/bicarbonate transport system substrate-binding protein
MIKLKTAITIIPLLALVACSTPATPRATISSTTAAKTGAIRVNISGSRNVTDVPFLMAVDLLRAQGYTVELIPIARFDVVTTALAKGDLDIAHTSDQIVWSAVAKNAPIVTLMSRNSDPYLIAANQNIKTCADLNGKHVALSATTGPCRELTNIMSNCQALAPISSQWQQDRYPGLISAIDAALLSG